VHHEQGVSAGAGAVHPGRAARHPEPQSRRTRPPRWRRSACGRAPGSRSAARAVSAATVPDEHGMPNSSPRASAVRSFDRNCPAYR
jgi:hypothetical protein